MHWKDLILQVFVPAENGEGRIGTGYPVANNVIMTAAHVVGNAAADNVEVCWWHGEGETHKPCKSILWNGESQDLAYDVVLLECDFPAQFQRRWGRVAAVRPPDDGRWASEGFPELGKKKDVGEVPLKGSTFSMGSQSDHLHLDIDASSETEEGWQGASGSPVIFQDSVIGVITDAIAHFKAGRFKAVPMTRLLENEAFRSLVGYDEGEDQHKQLRDAAVRALEKCELAMTELGESLKVRRMDDRHQWSENIVDELLSQNNPVKTAASIVKIQRKFEGDDAAQKQAVDCLDATAMYLIPASLGTDHVQQLRVIADLGQDRYAFHAQKRTFVEMGMARLHGRAANYRAIQSQKDEPPGILSLESPPESEIDQGGGQFKRDFVHGLRVAMGMDDAPESTDEELSLSIDEINADLEVRYDLDEGLHYYVFTIPDNENQRERRLKIIGELDVLLPRITFVGLAANKRSSEEFQTVRYVIRILCKSAGWDWKTDGQD